MAWIGKMNLNGGGRSAAWLFAGFGTLLILVGLVPLGSGSSNFGYWVSLVGFDRLGPLIPAVVDLWTVVTGLAAIAIAALLIAITVFSARGTRAKASAGPRHSGFERKLIDSEWVLTYDPEKNLTKKLSFNPDGTIGEGRHQNEHSWSMTEKYVDIFRESGLLHNRFEFHESGERLNYVRDPRAMGTKRQHILRAS